MVAARTAAAVLLRVLLRVVLGAVLVGSCAGASRREPARRGDPGAELRAAAESWRRALDARDADGAIRWFADDIVAWYPRPQPTLGLAANRETWRAVFVAPNNRHPITIDTVVVAASGDLAYTMGRYRSHYEQPGGASSDGGGRYVAVWRRDAAGWRIAVLSAHRHDPAPPVP